MKIKNPKLSVTVDEGALVSGYYLDSSNHIHYGDKTESTELIAVKRNDMFAGAFYDGVVGDMVNCTVDEENMTILITDPTKDASCSISEIEQGK